MFSSATGAPRLLHLLCAFALLLSGSSRVLAQGAYAGSVRTAVTSAGDSEVGELRLTVGRSALVNVGQPITRISLTKPEVADAVVTGTQQILVHGKAAGTISMFVWDRAGGTKRYDVIVGRDLSELQSQLQQLFPGEPISATSNGRSVALSGAVSSKYIIEKAAEVAAGYVEKKDDVVNLLRQQEGIATNQVLLRVRFAEVNRSALTELGVNLFSDGNNNTIGSSTTQQFSAPFFDQRTPTVGKNLVFSDYLNLFLFNSTHQIGLTIRAMQNKGLLQSLAEPNLIAEDGKEASFLAGGEYPYPVAQGTGANLMVTIVFKEFGIRLSFTPQLRGGDLIHLKVRPEVSSLDFANAVTYQGFRIPSLATRRAETEVELQDGQTFAIAGLLNNSVAQSLQKVPGIGDIPILGYLFRSKSATKQQTELVVMITPEILRRGSKGAAAGLPAVTEPFLGAPKKLLPPPPPRMPGGQFEPEPNAAAAAPAGAMAPAGTPAPAAVPPTAARTTAPAPGPAVRTSAPAAAQPNAASTGAQPRATAPPANPVSAPPAGGAAPASASGAAPPPAPPTAKELKQAEANRKAAEKAAAQKAEEDRKTLERAQKELKKKQAAEAKQKQDDAKQAEERRQAEQTQAAAREQEEARKAAQEQVKVEQQRLDAAKLEAAAAREQEERLMQERAKRDSEMSKLASDMQKKQTEAEKKRLKEIQEAGERLRAAQAAYEAAVERAKKTEKATSLQVQ
jgi:pilus assembly protein CpaC